MKTLQECKDEVARTIYGHPDWATFRADGMDHRVYEDAHDEAAELLARSVSDDLLETIHELFSQSCYQHEQADGSGVYDHMCISAYEEAQSILIEHNRIKKEQCYRP